MPKPRLALYWAASCGGCEIAVLELHEKVLEIEKHFDLVFWPVALDVKYADVEAMPPGGIDLCLFNGAIRTGENEHLARVLRERSKTLVAFGSCAHEGCIPALANATSRGDLPRRLPRPPSIRSDGVEPRTADASEDRSRCPSSGKRSRRSIRS
jgi:F420-non-reducing hydrogenase small subunit